MSTGLRMVLLQSFSICARSCRYLLPAASSLGSGFLALYWYYFLLNTLSMGSFLMSYTICSTSGDKCSFYEKVRWLQVFLTFLYSRTRQGYSGMGSLYFLLELLSLMLDCAWLDLSWLFSYSSLRICVSRLLFYFLSLPTTSLELVSSSCSRDSIISSLFTRSSMLGPGSTFSLLANRGCTPQEMSLTSYFQFLDLRMRSRASLGLNIRYFICDLDNNIMIDTVRPKLSIPDDTKITVDNYHNPYLNKLTMKVIPDYAHIGALSFMDPLKNNKNIAITQSLPLWRNQKFRIGLVWQQNIRRSLNRTHIGFLTEYQFDGNWVLKSKNLVGSSYLTSNQLRKVFALHGRLIQVSGLYSCFLEDSFEAYHTLGTAISIDNNLGLAINKRLEGQTSLTAQYERPLKHDLFFRLKYDTEIERYTQSELEVSLGYKWTPSISALLKTSIQTDRVVPNMAVEMEMKYKKNAHCIVSSVEYRNQKSVVFVGYKCPSFNLIMPIFGSDSPVLTIIGLGLYGLGYLLRKKQATMVEQQKEDTKQRNRTEELKLISDKANEVYRREEATQGLLVEQVYLGEKDLLERFLAETNRFQALNRNQEYKDKIFDGTISFRFYVQKGELLLPKGPKKTMLGLDYPEEQGKQIQVYIRYAKDRKEQQRKYAAEEEIRL